MIGNSIYYQLGVKNIRSDSVGSFHEHINPFSIKEKEAMCLSSWPNCISGFAALS
jgi:hypothetical protein